MTLMKSKPRVAKYGEVFTPAWLVDQILDDVGAQTQQIDARFLDPACGTGNFLTEILRRKLKVVDKGYAHSCASKREHALVALMSLYGIELLGDNVAECRAALHMQFAEFLEIDESNDFHAAAAYVLSQNIVNGDALVLREVGDCSVKFSEWNLHAKWRYASQEYRFEAVKDLPAINGNSKLLDTKGNLNVLPVGAGRVWTVSELAEAYYITNWVHHEI